MNWNSILGNWRTTLTSLVVAFLYFAQQEGITLPTDWKSFKSFMLAGAIAAFGAVAKDGKVGSQA